MTTLLHQLTSWLVAKLKYEESIKTFGDLSVRLAESSANEFTGPFREGLPSSEGDAWFFDAAYYQRQCRGLDFTDASPYRHYCTVGRYQGLSPCALFDVHYYGKKVGIPLAHDPFLHYLRTAGRWADPHPLFMTSFYLQRAGVHLGPDESALENFLRGAQGNSDAWPPSPHPLFDVEYYREHQAHFPPVHPLLAFLGESGPTFSVTHPLFDPDYYLQHAADVAAAGVNPLVHYLRDGGSEGRDPHPLFNSAWYYRRYPDVKSVGMNPLVHFVLHGANEGRKPNVGFDSHYYMARYPRPTARKHDNPLIDYVLEGWREGRATSCFFDAGFYRDNSLSGEEGVEPLHHFLNHGVPQGACGVKDVPLLTYLEKSEDGSFRLRDDGVERNELPVIFPYNNGEKDDAPRHAVQGIAVEQRPRVSWYLPPLIGVEGSGGYRTILECAHALAVDGMDVHVFCHRLPGDFSGPAGSRVENWFGKFSLTYHDGLEFPLDSNLYFATLSNSPSLFALRGIPASRCVYFVQDYEPWFFPLSAEYIEAEQSYLLGFRVICIGNWLPQKLGDRFSLHALSFPFGVDQSIYRVVDGVPRKPSVCLVHQPEKLRRCVPLALRALRLVKERRPDVELRLFGSRQGLGDFNDIPHRDFGLLSTLECSALYNSSQVGVCLSASNPSRIPFEMMACGLPLVDLDRENNHFDYPAQGGVVLAKPDAGALADEIERLLTDKDWWQHHSKGGISFMQGRGKSFEHQGFVRATRELLRTPQLG